MRKTVFIFLMFVFLPLEVRAEEARGAQVYQQHCGRCHNFRPPNERSDNEWSIVVAHMRTSGYLTGSQTDSVLRFLQASNNPVIDTRKTDSATTKVSAVLGKELLNKNACIGCHSTAGKGGNVGPKLDAVLKRRTEEYVKQQITDPRALNPTSVMPAYSFSESELSSIIEYLKSIE